jgi:hypothetical protein
MINCKICNILHNTICNKLKKLIDKYKNIEITKLFDEFKYYKNKIKKNQYVCKICNKKFTNSTNMKNHIINKICEKQKEFRCTNCYKLFPLKKNYIYHIQNKVCQKNIYNSYEQKNIINSTNNTQNINTQNINNQTIFNQNINNQNINNHQNIFIALPNLNTPNLNTQLELKPFRNASYNITPEKYLEYASNPEQAIKLFIKDEHFNPNKPERMNILNTNLRSNRVQIFDNDDDNVCRWMTKDKATVSELLYDRGVNHLFVAKNIIEANGLYLDPRKERNLKEKINEYETNPKIKKQYIGMISDLSYDYHNMIEENRKISNSIKNII